MVAVLKHPEIAPTVPDTAIDTVFEKLLADIVGGVYPAGSRLPAERELSRQLGASRPTLREALRRLDEWSLVEPRRGSGIVIRPYREWSLEVIAAYLKYGKPQPGQPSIARIIVDLLAVRRAVVLEVIRLTAARIPRHGTAGGRAAMARAWSVREQPSFAHADFERFALRAPADYVATYTRFFDAIENKDPDGACRIMGDYLDRHDQAVANVLGALS